MRILNTSETTNTNEVHSETGATLSLIESIESECS